jgi:hypothetical protein
MDVTVDAEELAWLRRCASIRALSWWMGTDEWKASIRRQHEEDETTDYVERAIEAMRTADRH